MKKIYQTPSIIIVLPKVESFLTPATIPIGEGGGLNTAEAKGNCTFFGDDAKDDDFTF